MKKAEIYNALILLRTDLEAEHEITEGERALLYDVGMRLGMTHEDAAKVAGDPPALVREAREFDASAAAAALGSITSPRKAKSSAANGRNPVRPGRRPRGRPRKQE